MVGVIVYAEGTSADASSVPGPAAPGVSWLPVLEGQLRPRLTGLGGEVGAVVVSASVRDPIAVAQQAHALDPDAAVVVFASDERCGAVTAAIQFAPFVRDIRCVSLTRAAEAVTAVNEAFRRTENRRRYAKVVSAANARIAASAAPVASRAAEVLGQLIQNAPVGIILLEERGAVRGWNPSASDILGVSEQEALGTSLDTYLDEAGRLVVARLKEAASRDGRATEVVARSAGGTPQHLELTVAPMIGRVGDRGFIVIVHDVTARERLTRELEYAVRVRDEFLSIASHELQTPLTPLKMHLAVLRRSLENSTTPLPAAAMLQRLEAIERQSRRIERLVREMLDVSRITARGVALEPEEVELGGLAREVVERFVEDGSVTRARCSLELQAEPGVTGRWDRGRMDLVITNLIANALKYGSGTPVVVAVRKDASGAMLAVSDQGVGIAPEDQARIFSLFERAAPSNHYGGFGVGLFLVKSIVAAHGGRVDVESAPAKGATFRVTLPLVPRADSP